MGVTDWIKENIIEPLVGEAGDYVAGEIRSTGGNPPIGTSMRCPNQPADAEIAGMLSSISATLLTSLSVAYQNVHGVSLPTNNPGEVGFAAYGGADCKVTTAAGGNYRAIFDIAMREYRGSETYTPPVMGPPGSPVYTPPIYIPNPNNPVDVDRHHQQQQSSSSALWLVGAVVLVGIVLLVRRS